MRAFLSLFFIMTLYGCGGGSGGSDSSNNDSTPTPVPTASPTPQPTPTPPPVVTATRTIAFSINESSEVQTVLSLLESDTQVIESKSNSGSSLYIYKNDKETEYRFNTAGELIGIYSDGQQAVVSTESDHYLITLDDRYSLIGAADSELIKIPLSTVNTLKSRSLRESETDCLSGETEDLNTCISTRIRALRQKVLSILVNPWYLPLMAKLNVNSADLEAYDEEELTEIEEEVEVSTSFTSQATYAIDDDIFLPTDNILTELKEKLLSQVSDIYTNLINNSSDIGNAHSPIDIAKVYIDGDIQQSVGDVFEQSMLDDDNDQGSSPIQGTDSEYIISGNIEFIRQFPLRETVDYYYQTTLSIDVLTESDSEIIESISSVTDEAQELFYVALAQATISDDKKSILLTIGSHANKMSDFFRKNTLITYKSQSASGELTENTLDIEFSPASVSFKERSAEGVISAFYSKYTGFKTVTDSVGTNRVVLNGSYENILIHNGGTLTTLVFQAYVDGIAEGEGWDRDYSYISENVYEPSSCQYSSTYTISNGERTNVVDYYADNTSIPSEKHCTVFVP